MVKERISLRKKHAMMTRQAIYNAGISLISKKGYYRVTIDDICIKAGVSRGTFYSHFKSKDAIVLEQFLKLDAYYTDTVAREMQSKRTAEQKLMAFTRGVTAYLLQMGVSGIKVAYQSQIGAERGESSQVASEERSLYTLITAAIVLGQKKGEIRNDMTADEVTRTVIRTMRGVIFDWCLTNGSFDLEVEAMRMFTLVSEGIRSK
jgi:TetR/AcrR family fatty acid metabolism transcriptional regulator